MLNKLTLIGNLGRDPEMRYGTSGVPVCTLNVATTRTWKGKDGQKQDETEWHRVTVFGAEGEACGKYLTKGRQVYVEARLQTRKYEKDGETRYSTDIIAERVQFLGGKQSDEHPQGNRPPRGRQSSAPPDERFDAGAYDGSAEDDIPF